MFTRIYHHHVIIGISHEINVGPTRVHGSESARILFNVGCVDILANLHRPFHPHKNADSLGERMVVLSLSVVNPLPFLC